MMSEFHPPVPGEPHERLPLPGQEPVGSYQAQQPEQEPYDPGGRRRRGRRGGGCLPVLIGLLVVSLLVAFGIWKGLGVIKDKFAGPGDFTGSGHGKVLFEVHEGDTATAIGRNLKDAGVVKSVDAFIKAATDEPKSSGIQVGTYALKKEMPAAAALKVLISSDNLVQNLVTVPEGLRVVDIVDLVAKKTGVPKADFDKWLAKADKLGLPDYADGNAEGYLFPATYDVGPKPTAKKILTAMIQRWQQAADDVDLEGAAARLGYTPGELMTVASLVQAEARGKYMPKVARVIYNRLETPGSPTYGLLQIDATVNYALGRSKVARPTEADRQVASPYNTYVTTGLPPTPIAAPGEDAMKAAANPAEGPWFFYVTVNLATGETKFAETLTEHNQYVDQLNEYCRTQSDRC